MDEKVLLASAAFILIIAVGFTYVLSLILPKRHYPRFLSLVIALAVIPFMAVFNVPGAWEACVVLFVVTCYGGFTVFFSESVRNWLFKSGDMSNAGAKSLSLDTDLRTTGYAFWPLISGLILGIIIAASMVSAVIIPPGYLSAWIMSKESLSERIERGLNPSEAWQNLRTRERDTAETLKRTLAEIADLEKRVSGTDANKQDQNYFRGIQLKEGEGQRGGGGTFYFGVSRIYSSLHDCEVNANSDKTNKVFKQLDVGQAINITSSRGNYRIVLTAQNANICTFDVVKD